MNEITKELLEALKDTLDFVERHSNRWDGVNGKHPQTVIEAARAAIAKAKAEAALAAPQPSSDTKRRELIELLDQAIALGVELNQQLSRAAIAIAKAKAEATLAAQPVTDDWIPWAGGGCPVGGAVIVQVKGRNGDLDTGKARLYDWRHVGGDGDIVAYQLVQK